MHLNQIHEQQQQVHTIDYLCYAAAVCVRVTTLKQIETTAVRKHLVRENVGYVRAIRDSVGKKKKKHLLVKVKSASHSRHEEESSSSIHPASGRGRAARELPVVLPDRARLRRGWSHPEQRTRIFVREHTRRLVVPLLTSRRL